jgi:hypothetical protein
MVFAALSISILTRRVPERVSIPNRGLWFLRPPVFQTLTVFSFQGSVAVIHPKSIISATGLSRCKKINSHQNQSQQALQPLGESFFSALHLKLMLCKQYSRKTLPLKKNTYRLPQKLINQNRTTKLRLLTVPPLQPHSSRRVSAKLPASIDPTQLDSQPKSTKPEHR